jgi:DNA-directed RNA polymerase subunit RPC12/RpoP
MKCINCGTDNTLKDRTNNQGRCKNCNHQFVFEPTQMTSFKITDPMFAKFISDISVNDTLFFTPKQLFYLLDNRLRKKSTSPAWGCFIVFFIASWIAISATSSFIILSLLAGFTIWFLFDATTSSNTNLKTRRENAKFLQFFGIFILAAGIILAIYPFNSFWAFASSVTLGLLSIYLGFRQISLPQVGQKFLIDFSKFNEWLNRWQTINGSVSKILPTPREENLLSPSVNPDVTAYSFDRLVVCGNSTIAQLLIANNFHFENNCAILSITGYPQSIFATTMEMLRRNPDLKVYAFHDCSPQGMTLAYSLRTSSNWFLDSNFTIIDVGLTPRQILSTKRGMFLQTSDESAQEAKQLSSEIRSGLSTEDLQWLDAGNFVELESFAPAKLIQILRRGISSTNNLTVEDNSSILIFSDYNDTGVYAVESFG